MNLGLGISIGGGASSGPPPFSAVLADGWRGTDTTPVDLSLARFRIARAAFDGTGAATTLTETALVTKRVRDDYPDEANFTADEVAFSEPVCAADVIAGAVNNSTLVSPKPVAAWTMPSRLLITNNTVRWSISAYHWAARNGVQVACVRVRANNGTAQTAWQTVTSPTLDTSIEGPRSLALYNGTLDITSFANGGFWLEAEVYPHVGTSASVLRSEDLNTAGANPREFTRRYFRKGPIPAWCAVSSTGNDTTGAASAVSEAAALLTPCLTVAGAQKKLHDLLGAGSNGTLDGARIVVVDAVNSGTVPFTGSYKQDIAGVVVTRATGTARSAAIVTTNANYRPDFDSHTLLNEGSLIFEDLTFTLGTAFTFLGETGVALDVQFINCTFNANSQITTVRSGGLTHLAFYGVTFTNIPGSASHPISSTSSGDVRILRGCTVSLGGRGYEQWVTIGNTLTQPGTGGARAWDRDGFIWADNVFLDPASLGTPINFRPPIAHSGLSVGGVAVVQNIIERIATGTTPSIMVGADDDFGNLTHAVIHHNTSTGVETIGRSNIAYDEHPTVARTHRFVSIKGNILPQLNTKGDVQVLLSGRIGHFPVHHGTSCAGNFVRDASAGPLLSFGQAYPGVGSVIAGGDALFTDNKSVTGTLASPVAGTGGGTYTLQSGSPARDLFSEYLLPFDIAGTARPTSGTVDAGCYA